MVTKAIDDNLTYFIIKIFVIENYSSSSASLILKIDCICGVTSSSTMPSIVSNGSLLSTALFSLTSDDSSCWTSPTYKR